MFQKPLLGIMLLVVLIPVSARAKVNEYQAEKSLYQATRMHKVLSEETAQPTPADYNKVITAYQNILTRFPDWNQRNIVLLLLGELYTKDQQYEKAQEAFLDIIRDGYQKMMNNQPFNPNLCAQARYRIALNSEAQGNWEEAEKHLVKVVADYPKTLIALNAPLYRADHYYQAGNQEEAERIYQEALSYYLDIIDKNPHSRLSLAAKQLIEKSYKNVKQWGKMAQSLQEAINNSEDAKSAFVELGKIYIKQNKIDSAIEIFNKVIKKYPDYYEARLELGSLYNSIGRYDLALAQAEYILNAQDYNVGAIILKAYVDFYKRNYRQALKNFKRAINLDAEAPELYNMVGMIELKLKQYGAAREALETSISLQPDAPAVHINLGNIYLAEKNYQQAEKEFQKALKQNPKYLKGYASLAALKVQRGLFDDALASYNKILEINPELYLVQYHLGEIFEFKKDFSQAIKYYQKTIKDLPKFWEPYNNLAYLYADQSQSLDEALRLARKAIELSENNSSSLDTLGFVYYKLKKLDLAEKAYLKALALAPNHPYILYHLALLNMEKKDPGQAKKYLKKAIDNGLSGELNSLAKKMLKGL